MFERSVKLSLHIPKRFNAFQVLKWFLLLLEVTCVIFARATNTDVWQAIVACAIKGPLKYLLMPLLGKNQSAITLHMYASIAPNLDNTQRGQI